jgi:hypothetical protein
MEKKDRKRRSKKLTPEGEYKGFCRAFSSCKVETDDSGCLGGF